MTVRVLCTDAGCGRVRREIPNPIYKEATEVCLFVKDHDGEGHKAAKARVRSIENSGVQKVIGLSKLKANYFSFEQKRKLCDSYELFLADDRILPSLPKLLGKSFFKKKK
jgi:ribosome biogenesis protein UTP30